MSEKGTFKYHPIQLVDIEILTVIYERVSQESGDNDNVSNSEEEAGSFKFYHTHSHFDEKAKVFVTKVKAEINESVEGDDPAYHMKVELAGAFRVDVDNFPIEKLDVFAEKNAPLVLYPYLREQVFGLASRVGVSQPILPLFEVPPFKLNKVDEPK